ncbi:MAG TPA: mechanosensitive ion channel family protein, partial [Caldilineaceae bacterium]|nr:mechanosensitive ion channel family protein [Caldilineaceae bacterium]
MFEFLQSLDLELRNFPIGLVLTVVSLFGGLALLRRRIVRVAAPVLPPRWLFLVEALLLAAGVLLAEIVLRSPFVQQQLDPAWVSLIYHTALGLYWLLGAWLTVRGVDLFFWNDLFARAASGEVTGLVRNIGAALIYLFFFGAMMRFVFERPVIGVVISSGVVLVLLGLAANNLLVDLFAGLGLTLDTPYRVGDWIELPGGVVGRVVDMTWRSTRLLSANQSLYVVPNHMAAQSIIHNYGLPDRTFFAAWTVTVGSDLPPTLARPLLRQAIANTRGVLKTPAPTVRLAEAGDAPIRYTVRAAVESYEAQWEVREEFYLNLWAELGRAGIPAPTARLDLQAAPPELQEPYPPTIAEELRTLPAVQRLDEGELAALARSAR